MRRRWRWTMWGPISCRTPSKGLRGDSVVLMGKNTLIRRCIRIHAENTCNDNYLKLLPLLVGNVGLTLTKGDLKEVSEEVAKY